VHAAPGLLLREIGQLVDGQVGQIHDALQLHRFDMPGKPPTRRIRLRTREARRPSAPAVGRRPTLLYARTRSSSMRKTLSTAFRLLISDRVYGYRLMIGRIASMRWIQAPHTLKRAGRSGSTIAWIIDIRTLEAAFCHPMHCLIP